MRFASSPKDSSTRSISSAPVKRETLEILKEHAAPILKLQTDEEVETLYEEWAQSLETKPYPSLQAISNVFQLALRRNPRSEATTRSACGIPTLSEN